MSKIENKNIRRIYRNQSEAVVNALWEIFTAGGYADKVIERTLKADARRGSGDRAFIADTVYGVVRYRRLLEELCGIKNISTPRDVWQMVGVYILREGGSLPPWEEFQGIDIDVVDRRYDSVKHIRAIRESIPDWIDEVGVSELSDVWDAEIAALNRQAQVILRANTLKTTREALKIELEKDGILSREVENLPNALELVERKNVWATKAFASGMFEVQDASSQRVAALLAPQPGMRVVDACAGAGGKTLHLASLMENRGSVIAMDIYPYKLEELRRRARRAGVSNVTTRVIEGSKTIKRMAGTADRLLLDVPCSGMGILRRNPDAKWKLRPEFLDEITATQYHILSTYSKILKPGGRMVYATCSILPRENARQVERFLNENSDYRLIEQYPIYASVDGYDGFYMALLEKNK